MLLGNTEAPGLGFKEAYAVQSISMGRLEILKLPDLVSKDRQITDYRVLRNLEILKLPDLVSKLYQQYYQ